MHPDWPEVDGEEARDRQRLPSAVADLVDRAHGADREAAAVRGQADAALGRVARFTADENQEDLAVVHDAWADAHSSEVQAAEHTADAGALRAEAANLYSPSRPAGPTAAARLAAAAPRPSAQPTPVQRHRPRAGR